MINSPDILMFKDHLLNIVNIILLVGIVLALFVAPKIKEGTRELHIRNRSARRRLYGHDEG